MKYRRMTIALREDEADALFAMAERARRYPQQQVQWLVAKAAAEAGLLENESGNGVSVDRTTVTRSSHQMAAA